MNFGEKNLGAADRAVRVFAGAALLAAVVINYFEGPAGYAAILFGSILVATGLLGTCGLYTLLGASTCEIKRKKKK